MVHPLLSPLRLGARWTGSERRREQSVCEEDYVDLVVKLTYGSEGVRRWTLHLVGPSGEILGRQRSVEQGSSSADTLALCESFGEVVRMLEVALSHGPGPVYWPVLD